MVSGDPLGDPGEISRGDESPPGETDPGSPEIPFIRSQHKSKKEMMFWANPSDGFKILYDQWEFCLYGSINESYEIWIGLVLVLNGSMTDSYMIIPFDAGDFDLTNVTIKIGSREYFFRYLKVNHHEISTREGSSPPVGKYFETDLQEARIQVAIAIILMSLVSVWFAHIMIKFIRNMRGPRPM